MKRITLPVILGLILLMCGGVLLLQAADVLKYYERWFWASVFIAGGVLFLIYLFDRVWWTVFPGFPLLAIAATIIIFPWSPSWAWAAFFIVSSLSFWVFYFSGRDEKWWALMPAGLLVSFGLVIGIEQFVSGAVAAGICSLGLSLTLVLVIALTRSNQWAYIPAGALATTGVLIMAMGTSAKAVLYICSAVLILVGLAIIVKNIMVRK
jgi:hypothetical protein